MGCKYALLIGVSIYDDPGLSKLEAPPHDISELRKTLEDQEISAFDKVWSLVNEPRDTVMDALHELYEDRAPDDLVFLYFSGHGVVDAQNRFFLGVAGTRLNRLRLTGVHYRDVHELMDDSHAKGQLVILDCCHAGAFAARARAATGTTALSDDVVGTAQPASVAGEGRWILAATDATSFAFEREELVASGDRPQIGIFTAAIIEGLRGAAGVDNADYVDSDALFAYAESRVREQHRGMRPQRWVSDGSVPLRLARRVRPVEPQAELPPDSSTTTFAESFGAGRQHVEEAHLMWRARQTLSTLLEHESDGAVRGAVTRALSRLEGGDANNSATSWELLRNVSKYDENQNGRLIFRSLIADWCPEMALISGGKFQMGGRPGERGYGKEEGPIHSVRLKDFAIGRFLTTFSQYDKFCEIVGLDKMNDHSWGRSENPVINVSWEDANTYANWISFLTGFRYRLPSEAEWEFAARAGTKTGTPYGDEIRPECAVYRNVFWWSGTAMPASTRTAPVGTRMPNNWGLCDMLGNVWEWVEDHWHPNYRGAPRDGSPWLDNDRDFEKEFRVMRGGSWDDGPWLVRSATRHRAHQINSGNTIGFRLAMSLEG